ncbi:MAG: oligosaccharide flippase family protein [Bacteroidales bacterium]|nr:oligosaccharide flippase family protein [Bacteroidales bacterium]
MKWRQSIVGEMGTLLSGNVLAQVISLAAYFALTRIFPTEDYGLYSIFYSYIEVLIIVSTCKYELALVSADSDREADAMARFTLRLNAIVSAALLTVALVLWLTGALPGNFAQLGWMVLLIPPMVFFCGTSRVYSFLFNRSHRYGTMAASETVNAAAGALSKIALGLLGVLQAGMPVGTVAGRAIGNLVYRLKMAPLAPCPLEEQRAAARKHRNFPRYVATKDFVNSFSSNLPFLWLALYFDRADVGLFALALTFTFRPVNILNVAFEQVLYARTAERVREGRRIGDMIGRFLLVLNAVALPLFVLAWFVAEPVFGFCFGGRWAGCGVYVRALLPWVYLMLSSTSLMFISNVFGTQRTEFFFYLVLLVLRVAAIAVGIAQGDFLMGIRLYAAAGALVAASLLVWYLWQVRRYEITLR